MFPGPGAPFVPPQFGIKPALEAWERDAHFRLRRQVFCVEQGLFAGDDRDAVDDVASAIVAVDYIMSMSHQVVGTVRIHDAGSGTWRGSRLAIRAPYRNVYGLGSALVHRAVSLAHARGCRAFLATVQPQNVNFFRRLSWEALEDLEIQGRPHVLMRADLAAYPPDRGESAVAIFRSARAS
jgi:putative N-acetyltransferase (TIGR04045 family)